jgi:hypothetical protein
MRLFCVQYGGKMQAQAVLCQSSFYSCNDSRLHFGLGAFSSVDLDIDWPNGLRGTIQAPCGESAHHAARRIGNCQEPRLEPRLEPNLSGSN